MNRFEFLKKIKFHRPSVGQIIFWGVALVLSIGMFVFARNFTTCFAVANLPGISPCQLC